MSDSAASTPGAHGLFDRIAARVQGPLADLEAADPRADGSARSVSLSRDRVTIGRTYHGIAMRVSVPVSAYKGVCVAVRHAATGGFVYELKLAHADPDLSVMLSEATNEHRIWADWRASAGYFELPALIERNQGVELSDTMIRAGDSYDRRARRRHRPGIVTRRTRRPEAFSIVHREDEIIARE